MHASLPAYSVCILNFRILSNSNVIEVIHVRDLSDQAQSSPNEIESNNIDAKNKYNNHTLKSDL